MNSTSVLVYGAYGHTGRFVVDELIRRGLTPVLAGRDAHKLEAYAAGHPGLETRAVAVDDAPGLRYAVTGVAAVINTAGPFLDTALPLASAAVGAGAHYLDVTAEQGAVQAVYEELDEPAGRADVGVVPAMAFYGGLADLLVTTALDGSGRADEVTVAVGLDRWWPTAGTRTTGQRNTAPRLVVSGGQLTRLEDVAPGLVPATWQFPEPLGDQAVVALPFSEVITINRHLAVGELRSYLNTASLSDLRDPNTRPPEATDETGRSAQQFVVDVAVRQGDQSRRISASGRDIYAVSAPIVVEAAARLVAGDFRRPGAAAPGEIFDAADFLSSLPADSLELSRRGSAAPG
jgi:NAD(P)-dependent dehydrogenase (short-subunit alcohol dehydrogenase family)